MIKEALFWEKLDENRGQCHLCAHECRIPESKFGICGVRQNVRGVLYTMVYARGDCRQHRPHREEAPLSFPAGLPLLLHCHDRLQFQMRLLSKLADFSGLDKRWRCHLRASGDA